MQARANLQQAKSDLDQALLNLRYVKSAEAVAEALERISQHSFLRLCVSDRRRVLRLA
jgi:hypothetical protein